MGSWDWDLIEDEAWWSEELYRMLGYEHHPEASFEMFFEHVHPDDRGRVQAQLQATFERNEPYAIEFRNATLTCARWVHWSNGSVRVSNCCRNVSSSITSR